jgi:hypothetical protein
MRKNWIGLSLTLAAALSLQACGGGDSPAETPRTRQGDNTPPAAKAAAQGTVYDAATGQALAGVQVTVSGQALTTDSQGRFSVETTAGQSLLVVASKAGYTSSQSLLSLGSSSAGSNLLINLTQAGATQTIGVATGGVVTAPGSTAQVNLPAAALVDALTNQPATGNASVTVTPIDPASQSRAMPGTFKASDGTSIESFGAIQVTLADAAGRRLQLAAGKTATIRIPLRTRSLDTPATIPLYYLNEATGLWVQEGSATLKGNATAGFYYEGTVSHFSTWNADRPITETVYVQGCVRNADNSIPTQPVTVMTDGLDYSGAAFADVSANGTFRVALKRNARASLVAEDADHSSAAVTLEPATADIQRSECLVLAQAPALPVFLLQPTAIGTLVEGGQGLLMAGARGAGQVRYQWQRNGVNLPGQTGPMLVLSGLTLADNGAKYTVVASTGAGSVTSAELSLVVVSSAQQDQVQRFTALLDAVTQLFQMSSAPSATVDFDNGTMLAPAQVCGSGSLGKLTLDGRNVAGGEAISPTATHTLDVAFANCATTQDSGLEGVFTGAASASFSYSTAGTIATSTQLTALTNTTRNLKASGQFAIVASEAGMTITPAAGATLTHATGANSSNVLTITGGSMGGEASGNVAYRSLGFTLNSVPYVLNGGFSIPAVATDEIRLQTGGKTVGRIWFDTSSQSVKIEAPGPIPAF